MSEKRTDTNKDCKPDQIVFYEDGKAQRSEQDSNFDGRVDIWIIYGPDGKPSRQEIDTNGDGKRDRFVQLQDGVARHQLDDKNGDGKPDSTLYFAGSQPEKLEEDTNFDTRTDRTVTFRGGKPAVIEEDKNFDDKWDALAEFNPDGSKKSEQQDSNDDGKYDVTIHYANGKKVASRRTPTRTESPMSHATSGRIARREAWTTTAASDPGQLRRASSGARPRTRTATAGRLVSCDTAAESREEIDTRTRVMPTWSGSSTPASACGGGGQRGDSSRGRTTWDGDTRSGAADTNADAKLDTFIDSRAGERGARKRTATGTEDRRPYVLTPRA
jgi:antitoxin component YwqK of YwqJK toxin-antitoxin module